MGVKIIPGLNILKPKDIKPRFRAFFYGDYGVGKTIVAINFPSPLVIDTEEGAVQKKYIRVLEKVGGDVAKTCDFDDLLVAVKSLMQDSQGYKTLVIDPLTIVYEQLIRKMEKERGDKFGIHYKLANEKMQYLVHLLSRLDMNVIITAHSKKEYAVDLTIVEKTFDCYKKLPFMFDLTLEVQVRGNEHVGIVRKTRLDEFIRGEVFPWSYDVIADKHGRAVLEREAVALIFATPNQVNELLGLIELLKISEDITHKWLIKANAMTFEDMEQDKIQACINSLRAKIVEHAA